MRHLAIPARETKNRIGLGDGEPALDVINRLPINLAGLHMSPVKSLFEGHVFVSGKNHSFGAHLDVSLALKKNCPIDGLAAFQRIKYPRPIKPRGPGGRGRGQGLRF